MSAANDGPVVYGVDFGMTNSSLAIMAGDGSIVLVTDPAPIDGMAEVIPTAVCLTEKGGGLLVGGAAVNAKRSWPTAYRDNFKRDVRRGAAPARLAGTPVAVVDMVAAVLRLLWDRAQQTGLGPPAVTMLTTPADWAADRKEMLTDAAILAGFPRESIHLIDEPTAAMVYAQAAGVVRPADAALVYDLGGGTFDCAVLRPGQGGAPAVRVPDSRPIGGRDFDQAIYRELKHRLPEQFDAVERADDGCTVQLVSTCESMKKRLSRSEVVHEMLVELPQPVEVEFSREQFDRLIGDMVDDTLECAKQALSQAGLSWDEVDAVVPVGGSTLVPLVERRLAARAPGRVRLVNERDTAVVRGAAVLARHEADRQVAKEQPSPPNIGAPKIWTPKAVHAAPDVAPVAQVTYHPTPSMVWLWLLTIGAVTTGGYLAWRHWPRPDQILLALALAMIVSGVARFSAGPPQHPRGAGTAGFFSALLCITYFVVSLVYAYRALVEHHGTGGLGWWAFGVAAEWFVAALVAIIATDSAIQAKSSKAEIAIHKETLDRVANVKWFSLNGATAPHFLAALFDLPALRGFEMPTPRKGVGVRYVLAAGGRVVLVMMLSSGDQRPQVAAMQADWAQRLKVDAGAIRTILVAPQRKPPSVSADDQFEITSLITTEPGVKDIIGRWLEQDNSIDGRLLTALLKAATADPTAPARNAAVGDR